LAAWLWSLPREPIRPDNGVTPGFTYKGTVHLVREGLPDRAEVLRTLWHELLHFGLRRFLTRSQYIARLNDFYQPDTWI
jgi:hypothetical protein